MKRLSQLTQIFYFLENHTFVTEGNKILQNLLEKNKDHFNQNEISDWKLIVVKSEKMCNISIQKLIVISDSLLEKLNDNVNTKFNDLYACLICKELAHCLSNVYLLKFYRVNLETTLIFFLLQY